MTPLQKTLKRLLTINGRDYVIAISPDGFRLTPKGKRKGIELQWEALERRSRAGYGATGLRGSIRAIGDSTSIGIEIAEGRGLPRSIEGQRRFGNSPSGPQVIA
jgi:hypothetical protein